MLKSKYSKLSSVKICCFLQNRNVEPITHESSPAQKMGIVVFCACILHKLTFLQISKVFLFFILNTIVLMYFSSFYF